MIISKKKMQKIAEEIGLSIKKDVNIMNETGIIIASTDLNRIGTEHAGAVKIIRERLDRLYIEGAQKYGGSRDGVNFPLQINGECVGVVGITGPVTEVEVLGTVIKKMTEILIIEELRGSQNKAKEDIKNNFAIQWLFSENTRNTTTNAELLGIRLDISRIVVVSEIILPDAAQLSEVAAQEKYEKIAGSARKEMEVNKQQFLLAMGPKIILFFEGAKQNDVKLQLERLNGMLENRYNCRIISGVGTAASNMAGVRASYKEADVAYNLSRQLPNQTISLYLESDVRMLLGNIPQKNRKRFEEKVFGDCTPEQTEEIVHCLKCYMESNGSVSQAAESMYIHKNTLQYRLQKMKTMTGYDPRIISESIPLYLAMFMLEFTD